VRQVVEQPEARSPPSRPGTAPGRPARRAAGRAAPGRPPPGRGSARRGWP
jgi:hypothetical protein